MIVSTIIKNSDVFGGNYDSNNIPENRIEVNVLYTENYLFPKWNSTQWIEGAAPEEIQEQENQQKQQQKQQQYEELLPTDWYVVRFIETGIAIPEEILQQRQAIRNKYS